MPTILTVATFTAGRLEGPVGELISISWASELRPICTTDPTCSPISVAAWAFMTASPGSSGFASLPDTRWALSWVVYSPPMAPINVGGFSPGCEWLWTPWTKSRFPSNPTTACSLRTKGRSRILASVVGL